jgi:hypothetical protein
LSINALQNELVKENSKNKIAVAYLIIVKWKYETIEGPLMN